ncbi:hypothetical protein KJ616_02500 [Patescibacteria group bacterium]|nr:hypothetical protein [Patescibacteria group bacterium]
MKKNSIISLVICLLGIFIFFFLGYFVGKTPVLSDKVSKEQIQREFLNELRGAGIILPLPSEIKTIAGDLADIGQDFIIIRPKEDNHINILGVVFPEKMKFLIDQATVFRVAHEKSEEEFIKEYEFYISEKEKRVAGGESAEGLVSPLPYSYENIDFGDLKIGDSINITCNVDVLSSTGDIYAKEIDLMNEIENGANSIF